MKRFEFIISIVLVVWMIWGLTMAVFACFSPNHNFFYSKISLYLLLITFAMMILLGLAIEIYRNFDNQELKYKLIATALNNKK